MPQDSSHDVEAIREWLAKESHLPTDFGDLILKKFLHSCYGSLEKTKKCIDRFCTTRATMSEAYCGRDPLDPKLQTAFEITIGGKRKPEEGIGNKPKILRTRSEPLNLPDEEFRKKLGSSDYNLAGCANKQLI